jgi:large subunit ribosomal protein L18
MVKIKINKSNKFIYIQAIDDDGKVLFGIRKSKKMIESKRGGLEMAEKLLNLKIKQVVFDRNRYRYQGRVKEVAEGLRGGGIKV